MTENRRYYYLKLKEYFFNSETMMILESMQDGLLYSNLLLKMYLMSLKSGGILLLGDHFPHTPQTIATCTRHQIGTVERALKIFLQLGLIEILTDGAYYMTDIQLLIGQSSTEGERKKRERSRLQRQKLLPSGVVDICPPAPVDKCPPILERDKDIEIDIEKDRELERGRAAPAAFGRYQNVFLSAGELSELQADFPTVWQEYIERLSEYMASTGKTYKNHAATIRRWVAEDSRKTALPARNRDYTVKAGTGCVSQINEKLWEGRYSPIWPDGKKHACNVYAHSEEECERLLAELIAKTKEEIRAEKERLKETSKAS